METKNCIQQRRSIRRFQSARLPDELIAELVGRARCAPSWANTQAVRYFCIADPKTKSAIGACCGEHNRRIVDSAPNLFVITAVKGLSGLERGEPLPYPSHTPEAWLMIDCGIAVQTLCLAAWDMGVGTVIMGGYDIERVAKILALPENQVLAAVVAAGYPDEDPAPPRRRELSEILRIL